MRVFNDLDDNDLFSKLFDYDGSGNLIYAGSAKPGSATTDAAWAIRKFAYTGVNLTSITWAGGNTNKDKVWDDRAAVGTVYS